MSIEIMLIHTTLPHDKAEYLRSASVLVLFVHIHVRQVKLSNDFDRDVASRMKKQCAACYSCTAEISTQHCCVASANSGKLSL